MTMSLAIIAEKPALLRGCLDSVQKIYPDIDLDAVPIFFPVYGWFTDNRYRIPHGLKWSKLPLVAETVYKKLSISESKGKMGARSSLIFPFLNEEEGVSLLENADQILLLMDASSSGIHMAARFVEDNLGYLPAGKLLYPWLTNLTERGIDDALNNARYVEDFALDLIQEGRNRRHFDFNYICNSIPVLGAAAREAGLHVNVPSKFGLQLLYKLKVMGSQSEYVLSGMMQNWTGSGKYQHIEDVGLGSAISRMSIINDLVRGGYLIEKARMLELSEEGDEFLRLLHPDCNDPDLPFRYYLWSQIGEKECRKKMDRYIRTFFERQMKFFDIYRASSVSRKIR